MIDDHLGRTAGRATMLVRAVDEILGTHNDCQDRAGRGMSVAARLILLV
jgi:hypothetical protein